MANKKYLKVVSFCIMVLSQNLFSQIVVQGTVTDNGAEYLGSGAEPVHNAKVTLIDQAETNRTFSAYTNEQGHYEISISSTGVYGSDTQEPGSFVLLPNYPNPFNPSTVIGYQLKTAASIQIEIYNVLGQKVKTLLDGLQPEGTGFVLWDGTDDYGRSLTGGVYLYSLRAKGIRINKKMVLLEGHQGGNHVVTSSVRERTLYRHFNQSQTVSDMYRLRVTGENIATYEQANLEITENKILDFTVTRTVTDIDGNVYPTVKIRDKWWMAENLKVTHYRNGVAIPNVTDATEWINLTSGAYCNYNNNVGYVYTWGRFYNWYAVNDPRGLAPEGWHVPTDEEWKELEMILGMSQSDVDDTGWRGTDEGGKLKEIGTVHWDDPNTGATNESGFTALAGGYRDGVYSNFNVLYSNAYFWSSTEVNSSHAWYRVLGYFTSEVDRYEDTKRHGFSIRCLKDN
jgi:uncharacterized protein (TIGR02145 family)